MYKMHLNLEKKKKKIPKLVKKENENKWDILFTYVIRKHYKNVIITRGNKTTKLPIDTEKISRNNIE